MTIPELITQLRKLISEAGFSREGQEELEEQGRNFNSTLSDDTPGKWIEESSTEDTTK